MGIWVLFSVIWIICNVRTYLGCKRNINKAKKHYREVTPQMLEHKRRELENESLRKKERQRRQELRQQQRKHARNFQPIKEDDRRNFITTTNEVTSIDETEHVNDQSSYNAFSYQSDMTMIFENRKEKHTVSSRKKTINCERRRRSVKDIHPTNKLELSEEMKKLRKGLIMAESKEQSTEYDEGEIEKQGEEKQLLMIKKNDEKSKQNKQRRRKMDLLIISHRQNQSSLL
ncbi:Zinc finger protein [Dirofilaria immitis]